MNLTESIWIACAVIFGGMAVWGLTWAVRAGQLDDLNGAAVSIFDDDEPVGHRTDGFPQTEQENVR